MELELKEMQIALKKQLEKNKQLMKENRELKQEVDRLNNDLKIMDAKRKRPNNQRPTVITNELVSRVLMLRQSGQSIDAIAKEVGVSRSTVDKIIKQIK